MNAKTGFTLLECLIAISLLLIFVTSAVPIWQHWRVRRHLQIVQMQISQAVRLARVTAILSHKSKCIRVIRPATLNIVDCESGRIVKRFVSTEKVIIRWRSNLGRNEALKFLSIGLTDGQWGYFEVMNLGGHRLLRIHVAAVGSIRSST